MNYANRIIKNINYQPIQTVFHFIHECRYITQPLPLVARISYGKSLAPAIREDVMRRKLPENERLRFLITAVRSMVQVTAILRIGIEPFALPKP